jgi:hypothetical protein
VVAAAMMTAGIEENESKVLVQRKIDVFHWNVKYQPEIIVVPANEHVRLCW